MCDHFVDRGIVYAGRSRCVGPLDSSVARQKVRSQRHVQVDPIAGLEALYALCIKMLCYVCMELCVQRFGKGQAQSHLNHLSTSFFLV